MEEELQQNNEALARKTLVKKEAVTFFLPSQNFIFSDTFFQHYIFHGAIHVLKRDHFEKRCVIKYGEVCFGGARKYTRIIAMFLYVLWQWCIMKICIVMFTSQTTYKYNTPLQLYCWFYCYKMMVHVRMSNCLSDQNVLLHFTQILCTEKT